jgi:hypothetical protein
VPTLVEGEPATAALAAALRRVADLVPHLTAGIIPPHPAPPGSGAVPPFPGDRPLPADGELVPCPRLLDDPPWLGRIIRATGAGMGTDDPVVAASVFVQGYSYRVLTLTVACLCVSGVVPDASAPQMAIGLNGPWPSLVAFASGPALLLDPADLSSAPADSPTITDALRFVVHQSLELHLRPLVLSVRAGLGVPIGHRLLWGNIAASAATAFRTMEGSLGSFVEPLGHRFFALAPPELLGLGSFCVIEHHGRRGWFWERTNCCLIDRLPGAPRCADCGRTPAPLRRRAYRDFLDAS